jgi:hypothetical protein
MCPPRATEGGTHVSDSPSRRFPNHTHRQTGEDRQRGCTGNCRPAKDFRQGGYRPRTTISSDYRHPRMGCPDVKLHGRWRSARTLLGRRLRLEVLRGKKIVVLAWYGPDAFTSRHCWRSSGRHGNPKQKIRHPDNSSSTQYDCAPKNFTNVDACQFGGKASRWAPPTASGLHVLDVGLDADLV